MYAAEGKVARGELTTGMLPPPGVIGNAAKAPSKAYEIAKNGGKHANLIPKCESQTIKEIKKSIKSYENQIAKHKDKIANPSKHIKEWETLDPRHQEHLVKVKWSEEIKMFEEQRDILKDVLIERVD